MPVVRDTVAFESLCSLSLPEGIIFWEQGGDGLSETLKRFSGRSNISLFTGPEGGFSEGEIKSATEKGFTRTTLGKRILRAETAAIAAVAITQFALGDIGV